jgi:hypothetical protein
VKKQSLSLKDFRIERREYEPASIFLLQAVIYSIINDEHESPSKIKPELPIELSKIIKKTLNKNPKQRY